MVYRGSYATEREGATLALGDPADAPAFSIVSSPILLQPATTNLIGLRIEKVNLLTFYI